MIDMNEIDEEIHRLEHSKTSYSTCEKLAILYQVRNNANNSKQAETRAYSFAAAPSSEFLDAVTGAPPDRVYELLNQHFDAIKALYPKEYAVVIRKLNELKD